jgi:hypothetical protein
MTGKIPIDPKVAAKNYNKMFDAAISAGAKNYFSVEYEDRKNGLLKLTRKAGKSEYRIQVQFRQDSYSVLGSWSKGPINPLVRGWVKEVEDAIAKASGQKVKVASEDRQEQTTYNSDKDENNKQETESVPVKKTKKKKKKSKKRVTNQETQ